MKWLSTIACCVLILSAVSCMPPESPAPTAPSGYTMDEALAFYDGFFSGPRPIVANPFPTWAGPAIALPYEIEYNPNIVQPGTDWFDAIIAHEIGHYFVLGSNEHYADCFSARVMAFRNPNGNAAAYAFLMSDPNSGDATHGFNYQRAAEIEPCATEALSVPTTTRLSWGP
jgi:hypothetical protein